MYNFRYYAIGHSYLKHGPFVGWQTDGFWGMAASAPENDYFHKLQEGIKNTFDCKIEAIAENQASFERLCTEDATREKYTSSAEYSHMKEVLEGFKPNIITIFVGGGNTPAKDPASLSLFFDVLFGLVKECKRPEAVVIYPIANSSIYETAKTFTDKYGFICVDVSFIHYSKERDNPYHAFIDYPEYDEMAANGAVEFRTHPSDKGHAAIAEAVLTQAKAEIEKIPEGDFTENYSYKKYINEVNPARLKIKTVPDMLVSYLGFNIRQNGECVTFGSAPGTGASLFAKNFSVLGENNVLYAELDVGGVKDGDMLNFKLSGTTDKEYSLPIKSGMHLYEFPISDDIKEITSLRISPNSKDCVITVKQLGFKK